MAKKKLLTIEDSIKFFKDVLGRASLSSYYHVNNILLSKNDKDNKILIIPDQELWNILIDKHKSKKMLCSRCDKIFEAAIGEFIKYEDGIMAGPITCEECLLKLDKEMENEHQISPLREILINELDVTKPEDNELSTWFKYGEELDKDWLPINIEESLHTGKIFKIKMKDLEYQIPINRDLMPLKLLKNEYNGVSYKVFYKPLLLLAIKKRFDSLDGVENSGFSIIRLFQIV